MALEDTRRSRALNQPDVYRYFLRKLRKVKKANGQILSVNEVGAFSELRDREDSCSSLFELAIISMTGQGKGCRSPSSCTVRWQLPHLLNQKLQSWARPLKRLDLNSNYKAANTSGMSDCPSSLKANGHCRSLRRSLQP